MASPHNSKKGTIQVEKEVKNVKRGTNMQEVLSQIGKKIDSPKKVKTGHTYSQPNEHEGGLPHTASFVRMSFVSSMQASCIAQ